MEIGKIKLVLLALAVVVFMGSAVPAVADPAAPDWCGAWTEAGPWSYPSGYWWQWNHQCWDRYRGYYTDWGGWDGPY